jgi:hypothetical protein
VAELVGRDDDLVLADEAAVAEPLAAEANAVRETAGAGGVLSVRPPDRRRRSDLEVGLLAASSGNQAHAGAGFVPGLSGEGDRSLVPGDVAVRQRDAARAGRRIRRDTADEREAE